VSVRAEFFGTVRPRPYVFEGVVCFYYMFFMVPLVKNKSHKKEENK